MKFSLGLWAQSLPFFVCREQESLALLRDKGLESASGAFPTKGPSGRVFKGSFEGSLGVPEGSSKGPCGFL